MLEVLAGVRGGRHARHLRRLVADFDAIARHAPLTVTTLT